ncbi:hypothetical protein C8R44DRAFT_771655 [Mycena epipterygia]|nr:hypothetical protein C8R44DRAFT_771655 [Mycena epipterygia]
MLQHILTLLKRVLRNRRRRLRRCVGRGVRRRVRRRGGVSVSVCVVGVGREGRVPRGKVARRRERRVPRRIRRRERRIMRREGRKVPRRIRRGLRRRLGLVLRREDVPAERLVPRVVDHREGRAGARVGVHGEEAVFVVLVGVPIHIHILVKLPVLRDVHPVRDIEPLHALPHNPHPLPLHIRGHLRREAGRRGRKAQHAPEERRLAEAVPPARAVFPVDFRTVFLRVFAIVFVLLVVRGSGGGEGEGGSDRGGEGHRDRRQRRR